MKNRANKFFPRFAQKLYHPLHGLYASPLSQNIFLRHCISMVIVCDITELPKWWCGEGGGGIPNFLDGTGRSRKICVPNFRDGGTVTEILTCLKSGITKIKCLLCILRHNMAVLDLHALFIPPLREGRGYRNRGWSCSEQRKMSIHLFIQVGKLVLKVKDCFKNY